MKIAYFDCFSGISGDMTLAALVDAGANLEQIQAAIDSMGLSQVRLSLQNVQKNGFALRIFKFNILLNMPIGICMTFGR